MDKQGLFKRFLHVNAKLHALFLFFLFLFSACDADENEESGSLFLKLSSDFSITAVTKAESKALTEGPSVNDFKVAVYQGESGTSLFKTWDSFADMASEVYLPQNTYVLKASHGEQHKGAFETPYYEGTTPFSIIKRKSTSVSVVCKIANTKVTLEYSDGFKNYFKDWSAKVASTGDSLTFAKDETRGAYFEPGQVGMNLTMTRQDGKTITYAPPTVATEGGKHYRFRLDVTTGGAGGVNLVIRFDKTTEEKPIYVDISGDNPVIVSPPYISATGFSSGMPITVTEGTSVGKIYTLVNARGKIKSCVLRTESRSLLDEGWPASVDLADATANVGALKDKIVFTSGMKGAQMAEIDFTNLIPTLKASSQTTLQHTFTLEVTDDTGKKNEEFMLVAQMAVPGFRLLKLENVKTDGASAEGTADVRFEMTSGDPAKIKVQAKDDYGIWSDWNWVLGKEPKLTNVANVYLGTIKIKVEDKKLLRLNYNDGARISNSEYLYGGKYSFELEMADGGTADGATNPYVWATKAYVKIKDNTVNPYKLSFRKNDQDGDELETEILMDNTVLIKGLDAGTENRVVALVDSETGYEKQSKPFIIVTENNRQLVNNSFNEWDEFESYNLPQGGKTWVWTHWIHIDKNQKTIDAKTVSVGRKEPSGWITNNLKTIPDAKIKNTWYMIPAILSTGSSGVIIRNVAWNDNGDPVPDNTRLVPGLFGDSGNEPVPPVNFKYSVGKLFIGNKYSYDHSSGEEVYSEGISFKARPSGIRINYKYTPKNGDVGGTLNMSLYSGDKIVANCNKELNRNAIEEFDIEYSSLLKKATTLKLILTSSTKSSYKQEEENGVIKTTHNTKDMISTGSELVVYKIELLYE